MKNSKEALILEWNNDKNENLNLDDFSFGSHRKVWWKCQEGHEWEAQIKNRYNGNNCPYCIGKYPDKNNNLLSKRPDIAAEWNYLKNEHLKPENVCVSSGKKVWWICKNKHEWQATINKRNNGRNCPICSNRLLIIENSILHKNPKLISEWNYNKNKDLKPENFAPNSNKKVWWVCKNGHEWQSRISKRNNGRNCPYCSGNLPSKDNNLLNAQEIIKEWHPTKNENLKPEDFTLHSNKKVWWLCKKGHEFFRSISSRHVTKSCPYCSKKSSKISKKWLDNLKIPNDEFHREVFLKINSKKFFADGFDPTTKTLYEFLGDYWHGNPKTYPNGINRNNKKTFEQLYLKTLNRFKQIVSAGFLIIYRWESEDIDKKFDGDKL